MCHHRLQQTSSDDLNSNIVGLEPLDQKWMSFGWNVIKINGHDEAEISNAFNFAKGNKSKPTLIIANTIKEKGFHTWKMQLLGMGVYDLVMKS